MGFITSIKNLFSSSEQSSRSNYPEEEYEGFIITPTPLAENGQYRVSATVTKGDNTHQFVRADMLHSADACAEETLRKARLTIDQVGDGIFGKR